MAESGFESRIKVQDIIQSQLPEFILDESPKASEFLKQYYISQEFQGGTVDIVENLDQYLKLDNLVPEVVVGVTSLSSSITPLSETIQVSSTKGYPQKYGLIKIDNEIITYTGITTNTFTGCIRGFSAITDYHKDLDEEELVFSTSNASPHSSGSTVQNLSVLFLQEFYKKLKYTLTPGFESLNFVSDLNVGNFIKEAKTFYESKGTNESFRILFNVLFGEEPKVIDLEQLLIKPSSANYVRRVSVIADSISGDPLNLIGQSITKTNDSKTTASVSEVEVITRKGKTYYKLLLFVGYDDTFPTITGDFEVTSTSRNLTTVNIGGSTITVDSTIGFPPSGKLYVGNNIITYTSKSINQFFGCSGVTQQIPIASIIRSDDTYYGYENGDTTKKVEFRLTGVLSDFKINKKESDIDVGEKITIKNIGEKIYNNNVDPSKKEVFANSWIYNTSSRYQIDRFVSSGSQFILKSPIDKSSLKVGDRIDILFRDSQTIASSNLQITGINATSNQITVNGTFAPNSAYDYDIRRIINYGSSSSSSYSLDSTIFADIQNVYDENDEYMYVASNSIPSYQISKSIFSYNASGVAGLDDFTQKYSIITFSERVSFVTGSEVYYTHSQSPILGLTAGIYYVEIVEDQDNRQIRLYLSRNLIGTNNYLTFGQITSGIHNFVLSSQKEKVLSPQRILKKFPISTNIGDGQSDLTEPGSIGMLINGVEILNYKSEDKIYYGPLESVNILSGGSDYDVINPPQLVISEGSALVQPIVSGSVKNIYVTPQDFDLDIIVSVAVTGGNGKGASFQPVIEKRRREIEFDAREIVYGGGIDVENDTITFISNHGLIDGEPIFYRPGNASPIGIGVFKGNNFDTGKTLQDDVEYYVKYISDNTIQLYESFSDYASGINTVGFTTIGTSGIQKFLTKPKNTLSEIKIINEGTGYQNRKLRVSPTGISTTYSTVSFLNHGFNDGELITYDYQTSAIIGLSTTSQYYVIKIDNDRFRLADAGIGGTYISNYERKKYVEFKSTGSGYQIFNYPQISLNVEYFSVGIGSTQTKGTIKATPVVKGEIVGTYVYESGSDYGSNILNYHKKPTIIVKNGKSAQLIPIIDNGKIVEVSIQYGGVEYYSTPNIKVVGSGVGAILRPIILNNRISKVEIINQGTGYSSSNTSIIVEPSGKNVIFDPQVRSLTVNIGSLYDDINDSSPISTEILKKSNTNLQYYICGYSQALQNQFNRYESQVGFADTGGKHSPIIGWAYDGNPIYGSYGYSSPSNKNSSIKKISSGYTLNTSNIANRPSNFSEGFFVEDYQFTNSGDLDEYNGRFCVTPEFPNGVYAYFAITTTGVNGNQIGRFPYFVGNRYRSKFIEENKTLDQSYDFNNSNLIRNTFPYKIGDSGANNDFIVESNEVTNQITIVESVTTGSIDGFNVITSGDDYKVGDTLQFDETGTGGGGVISQVSELEGKEIKNLQTLVTTYNNAIFTWKDGKTVKVTINPNHILNNLDYVNVSGFSSDLSDLNGFYQVGVTSYSSSLISDIPSYSVSGIVTDIYVARIPENISIGSSVKIDNEIFSVLNLFTYKNIIRVSRQTTGVSHTATTPVYFIPDSFTINSNLDYFDSKEDDLVYFNPNQSVGVGTISGIGVSANYTIGVESKTISIPTQSIYLPNHPFKNNQAVTLIKPSSASAISVSNTSTSATFNIPSSGNQQTVYIIKKSVDHIGIVTQIGLTTTTNGLFFRSNGTDDYRYLIESNYQQKLANVQKISAQVLCDSNHGLVDGDEINLSVIPNLSVGIGTSTAIKVRYNSSIDRLLVNQKSFTFVGINTNSNSITISNHGFETGDKLFYNATLIASGLSTGFYYAYKIDDNSINLCETLKDSLSNPPVVVDIKSSTSSNNQLSLVNPKLISFKNNNLIFDLSDSSLSGYNFKIFYDNNFNDEFVSTAATSGFTVLRSGTVGSANARVSINCNSDIDFPLFYALEKSGSVKEADKDVQNYSEINFVDSYYRGSYKVSGIGSTSFQISLRKLPEKNQYSQSECDVLSYTTKSKNASGGIFRVRNISSGFGYKKLPVVTDINSESGNGAYIIPYSKDIGNVNQFRIINEGYEYSSDKTLRPEALISKSITLQNFSTIKNIDIIDGGKNYIVPPDLIVIDSKTRNRIESGSLSANLFNSTIRSVSIIDAPKGLPESTVKIVAINNTNGVPVKSVQYSSSGIVTCTIETPLFGFTNEPFAIGDKIYVEGIEKSGTTGDGFNSQDNGYEFFTISNYINGGSINPRKVEFNISGFTTNPGIASTSQSYLTKIINYNDYPKFNVTQDFSKFIIGEQLEVKTSLGFEKKDLKIDSLNNTNIKVFGTYELQKNDIIRGIQSGSLATINEVKESSGQFIISYGLNRDIGWSDDIGKISEDFQVISDNDYYQNLSYTIKSTKKWDDIVSPVNNLVHISGLKNFADTEIINNSKIGIGSTNFTSSVYDITDEKRVDTINNFDLALDIDVLQGTSRFLRLNNKKLSDYIECRTNRVLEIDDISDKFFTRYLTSDKITRIVGIDTTRTFEKYLVQIFTNDYSEIEFTEVIVVTSNDDTFTLEKSSFSNTGYLLGDIYADVDEFNDYYLTLAPSDPYNKSYNIKYLNTTFDGFLGIGTTSIGFVDLIGVASTVSVGSTLKIIEKNISNIESVHSTVHIIDNVTNEMNYIEFFVTHDGTDTYISDFYFDTFDQYSSNFIGTFSPSISGGLFRLNYRNTSSNPVTIRTKNVGFGSTSIGIGTYKFILPEELPGEEKTALFESSYSNISTASTIFSFDISEYTSIKSIIKVGLGETSSLHQLMTITDGNGVYVLSYPFLSIGSTITSIGIGTFGGELNGTTGSIKFYPDSEFSGTFEILMFNETFYSSIDYDNDVPPPLEYGNIIESFGVSKYVGINAEDSSRLNFQLNYKNTPIFMKKFNPSNSSILNIEENKFTIPNHFFNTGEELIYRARSSFSGVTPQPIGIGSTLNSVGIITNLLPSTLYAIRIDNDNFRVSTRKEYALANPAIAVTFTSTGVGNVHEIEMVKKNEKVIISVDNIIQYPISYTLLNYSINNSTQVGSSTTTFGVSGITSIRLGDILKVDDEYMKVVNVGLGTTYSGPISYAGTFPLVTVKRGFLGSSSGIHTDTSLIKLYRGSYNIVKDEIYFTEAPKGIGSSESIAKYNLEPQKSYFNGRVFLKKDYTNNKIYDDISEGFTGVGQTYALTVNGINTVGSGITSGSGILLINGIFQTPSTQNNSSGNYSVLENYTSGISSVIFSGNDSSITSDFDPNINELPRGGVIVSLGSTPGLGYAPLVGASVTAIIGAGGSITSIVPTMVGIGTTIGNWGSGYRSPVSIAITETGHSGTAATVIASVGAGGTLSFTILNGGSGYTNPTINISPPSYSNLPVIGVSRLGIGSTTQTGTGLLLNIDVGPVSTTGIGSTLFQVIGFEIVRSGYGYKKGDVLKPVGLVTAYGLSKPIDDFELTVLETFNDSFAAWQFGEMDYIDSIKSYQNGVRRRFPLYYNSQLISFEKNNTNPESQLIDFNSLLLIFVNGILQEPGFSYQFDGGTSFLFSDPPKSEDNVEIFFYRGSADDSTLVNIYETIKQGDTVQIFSKNNLPGITTTQDPRIVAGISSSTQLETNIYTLQGIDDVNYKPLSWTKQKVDKVINGELVSKSRDSIEPQIYPTAKIIGNLTSNQTEVFVDDAQFFNYEDEISIDFDAIIISGNDDPVSAAITAVVSAAGTIQSLSINDAGSGYIGTSVSVKLSAPKSIGVGIGTTATATVSIVGGSLSTATIINPGFGYSQSNPPQVIVSLPSPKYENIINISNIEGTSGNITAIASTVGIGTNLGIKFTLDANSLTGLTTGYPIYIFNTSVGKGVTSIINNNSNIVGVGTTFLDNIYYISGITTSVGIITCNVHSQSNLVGIATSGSIVGQFSWGKLSGFSRSSSPISLQVSGFKVDSGLSTFPVIQRRGYGLRDIGAIKRIL